MTNAEKCAKRLRDLADQVAQGSVQGLRLQWTKEDERTLHQTVQATGGQPATTHVDLTKDPD